MPPKGPKGYNGKIFSRPRLNQPQPTHIFNKPRNRENGGIFRNKPSASGIPPGRGYSGGRPSYPPPSNRGSHGSQKQVGTYDPPSRWGSKGTKERGKGGLIFGGKQKQIENEREKTIKEPMPPTEKEEKFVPVTQPTTPDAFLTTTIPGRKY